MKIVYANPPLIDEIDAKFNVVGKEVIFAWGDLIYNPQSVEITPELEAHERVHANRQRGDVEGWWRRYIEDDVFRLAEEVLAHAAEYLSLVKKIGNNRNARRRALAVTAQRIANPMYQYGRIVRGTDGAKRLLKFCLKTHAA